MAKLHAQRVQFILEKIRVPGKSKNMRLALTRYSSDHTDTISSPLLQNNLFHS